MGGLECAVSTKGMLGNQRFTLTLSTGVALVPVKHGRDDVHGE
jgi:hypothetical protein